MTKFKQCEWCGGSGSKMFHEDSNICNTCVNWSKTKMERQHHYVWMVEFALKWLKDRLRKMQIEMLNYEQLIQSKAPYIDYGISGSYEDRLKSTTKFYNQYLDIFNYLKQLHKILKYKDMKVQAEEIVSYLRSRNK